MRASREARTGVTTLVALEALAALLLLLVGVLLVDLALLGLAGGALLSVFGAFEIILGLMSLVEAGGLWMGKGWSWALTIALSIVSVLFNAGLIALAATVTLTVLYPGGPVLLLILVNDVIIAELGVPYFLTKPQIRSYLGKGPPVNT